MRSIEWLRSHGAGGTVDDIEVWLTRAIVRQPPASRPNGSRGWRRRERPRSSLENELVARSRGSIPPFGRRCQARRSGTRARSVQPATPLATRPGSGLIPDTRRWSPGSSGSTSRRLVSISSPAPKIPAAGHGPAMLRSTRVSAFELSRHSTQASSSPAPTAASTRTDGRSASSSRASLPSSSLATAGRRSTNGVATSTPRAGCGQCDRTSRCSSTTGARSRA